MPYNNGFLMFPGAVHDIYLRAAAAEGSVPSYLVPSVIPPGEIQHSPLHILIFKH